jgi:chemotaxis protein methyltransferase CheR
MTLALEPDELAFACEATIRSCGLKIQSIDRPKLQAFILQRCKQLGLSNPLDYSHLLNTGSAQASQELERLSEAFTSLETYFFRDSGQIQLLRETLLPELLAKRANHLRIWSCGCSSGEEIYTIAMLLDQLGIDLERYPIRLIGTDINPQALQRAKAARYGEWSFRGCPALIKSNYFQEGPSGVWTLNTRIRDMVHFSSCDLVHDSLPSPSQDLQNFDLILCRNVFIYFTPEAIQTSVRKLSQCLREGGLLLTGHGELLSHSLPGLQLELHPESAVFRRQTASPPALARPSRAAPTGLGSQIAATPPILTAKPAPAPLGPTSTPLITPTPSFEEEISSAWQLANSGQSQEARQACRALIQRDPAHKELHYLQALLEMELGHLSQASEALRRALYLDPTDIALYLQLAEIQQQTGMRTAAQRHLATAAKLLSRLPPEQEVPSLKGNSASQVLGFVNAQLAQLNEQSTR